MANRAQNTGRATAGGKTDRRQGLCRPHGRREGVKKYRLDCQCGATLPVGGGQAGDQVSCTACGQTLAVPTLRELSQLPVVADSVAGNQRSWDLSKGLLLLGGLLAVLSWGAAAWLRMPVESPVDPDLIRKSVMESSDAEIYDAWKNHFSTSTVSRAPMVVEKLFAQSVQLKQGLSVALLISGGVGAAIGLAGAAGVGRRRG